MISQSTIDQVNAVTDIVEVIKPFVKLKKQSANQVGLCPFHNENTPSFTVSPAKGIYKCFGCGRSGDAVQFLMDHEKKNYTEAIEYLANKFNVQVEYRTSKKEYVKPVPRLEKLDKKKLQFFEQERMISNDTLLKLKITEATEYMPQFKTEVPAICFNYYRSGELVNIKFRGPKKSFKMAKDAELIFYNIDATEGEKQAIIVEGEIDTATLVECGIYNVVGVPNGTPPRGSKMNLEYLDNCWEGFSKLESVIIAVDDDEVGRYLKEELARRIGKEKCKTVTYPEGCKDPNEILQKLGKQAVKDFVGTARDWPIEGMVTMDDMFETIVSYYENGYPPGAKAGVEGFDELLTFYPGHLTTVTGIPGHGKDEFTNELEVGLSKNEGWRWAIFNLEEPPEIHATKLMEKFVRKAFAFRSNPDYRMSRREFEIATSFIDQHFHFVNVSKIDVTMQGIIKKIVELVKRYGINGVVLNPWNYIEHKLGPGQSETHYVSEMLTLLINCLSMCDLHCLLIAHPTKMMKDKKTGKYEVPTLYSINGSSHFFNKTHNGICVYTDFEISHTTVHIQKVKFYWLGQKGNVVYNYNTNTRQYSWLETNTYKKSFEAPAVDDKPKPELGKGNWKKIDTNAHIEPDKIETEESEDMPF